MGLGDPSTAALRASAQDDTRIRKDHPFGGCRLRRRKRIVGLSCSNSASSCSRSRASCFSICTSPAAKRSDAMQVDDVLGLLLTLGGLAYLIYAMLRPEKF
jgi:K+-transporting ATPase KdpF subunit